MIRRINLTKARHRLDPDYIEMVSDDEPEVELPNVSGFLSHIRQIPEDPISSIEPTSSADNMIPTLGLNMIELGIVGGSGIWIIHQPLVPAKQ